MSAKKMTFSLEFHLAVSRARLELVETLLEAKPIPISQILQSLVSSASDLAQELGARYLSTLDLSLKEVSEAHGTFAVARRKNSVATTESSEGATGKSLSCHESPDRERVAPRGRT